MDADSDADVIVASRHEPALFGIIFDRHATVLHRYLVRRVGAVEADPLLGDLFLTAFEKRSTFDRERPSARPWLYGIATNLIGRHHRSEARRIRAVGRLASRSLPAPDLADEVSLSVDASRTWDRIAQGVVDLPRGERDALLLHVWESLTYQEVADALGIPIGTVRSRLNRARRRIRELNSSIGEQLDNHHLGESGS